MIINYEVEPCVVPVVDIGDVTDAHEEGETEDVEISTLLDAVKSLETFPTF